MRLIFGCTTLEDFQLKNEGIQKGLWKHIKALQRMLEDANLASDEKEALTDELLESMELLGELQVKYHLGNQRTTSDHSITKA